MKRFTALIILVMALFSCSTFSRTPVEPVLWPPVISYIEALCEIDVRWNDQKFSGTMALKMDYPDSLRIEIYGPFGETEVVMTKNKNDFLLITRDERLTDTRRFEEIFGISLAHFMEDIATKGSVARPDYRVVSRLDSEKQDMVWYGSAGLITMKFLEARFTP